MTVRRRHIDPHCPRPAMRLALCVAVVGLSAIACASPKSEPRRPELMITRPGASKPSAPERAASEDPRVANATPAKAAPAPRPSPAAQTPIKPALDPCAKLLAKIDRQTAGDREPATTAELVARINSSTAVQALARLIWRDCDAFERVALAFARGAPLRVVLGPLIIERERYESFGYHCHEVSKPPARETVGIGYRQLASALAARMTAEGHNPKEDKLLVEASGTLTGKGYGPWPHRIRHDRKRANWNDLLDSGDPSKLNERILELCRRTSMGWFELLKELRSVFTAVRVSKALQLRPPVKGPVARKLIRLCPGIVFQSTEIGFSASHSLEALKNDWNGRWESAPATISRIGELPVIAYVDSDGALVIISHDEAVRELREWAKQQ